MSDIFLSYAREEQERAKLLAAALQELGWSVFWDLTIPAGLSWDDFIGDELEKARCVVVAWSSASIRSKWVKEEAREGRARDVLVPVLFEEVQPPFGFRGLHAANLATWDGRIDAPVFHQLVKDMERVLGRPPARVKEKERQKEVEEAKRKDEEGNQRLKARAKLEAQTGDTSSRERDPGSSPLPFGLPLQRVYWFAAAAVITLLLVVVFIIRPWPGDTKESLGVTVERSTSSSDFGKSLVTSPPTEEKNIDSGLPPPLVVEIAFVEDCWVEATVDDQRRLSELHVQGETLRLEAENQVFLTLGNPGGVRIEVNGEPFQLGVSGDQIGRDLVIDAAALQQQRAGLPAGDPH